MRRNLGDPVLILLLLAAALLIFANLGNIYLWQDEAETAVVAGNTLSFGFPRGYDGNNTLWVTGGFGPNFIWIYHSWLQFYLVALSFLMLGVSTFAARFPFALLGLASIFLAYLLSWRLFANKQVSRIATLLLTFSVPYLLHLRQCRYHSLAAFAFLLVLLAYLQFTENKRYASLKLISCLILLFHSNHGIFIPVFTAISLHYLIFHFQRNDFKRLLTICFFVFLFTLPWAIILKSYHHAQAELTLRHLRRHFEFYIRVINKYVFPLAFFSVVGLIYILRKKSLPVLPADVHRSKFWLIALVAIFSIGFLFFVEQRHFRYLVHLIPILLFFEALILSRWYSSNRSLTIAVIVILLCSNFFNNPKIKFPLFSYLYEITHDYDGPNEGIVKFLRANAGPADTVKVPYADRPIIFYTGLGVDARPFFANQTYPEWIIWRRDWLDQEQLKGKYFQNIEKRYRQIVIDYPDIAWGNRPEPGYHKFRTVTDYPKVIIYKRKD